MNCHKLIEKVTNVHIEWTIPSAAGGTGAEAYNLMIAAGNYDDIIFSQPTAYNGGVDKAITDGVYLDAKSYIDLAPAFDEYRSSDENIRKQTTTDSGNVYFAMIQSGAQPTWCGPMVRTDWLEQVGLSTPKSFDDWKTVLTAFKDQLGKPGSLWLDYGGWYGKIYSVMGYGIIGGFDVNGTFFNKDGVVKFGPVEDGYREFLATMRDWYAEDLLYQDWPSIAVTNPLPSMTAALNNECGMISDGNFVWREDITNRHEDPNARFEAIPIPSKDGNTKGHFRMIDNIVAASASFITTAAVDRGVADLCAKWIDARYTDEVAFILSYGEEGTDWTLDSNGIPQFTDSVLSNPTRDIWLADNTDRMAGGLYTMWIRLDGLYEDKTRNDRYDVWEASASGDWVMPPVTLTNDETLDHNSRINDITTLIDEFTALVILGSKELNDTTWNEYVTQIWNMGIDKSIDSYQAALNRYMNR
jgi:putative aldouronate transport system substrate-binding protein